MTILFIIRLDRDQVAFHLRTARESARFEVYSKVECGGDLHGLASDEFLALVGPIADIERAASW